MNYTEGLSPECGALLPSHMSLMDTSAQSPALWCFAETTLFEHQGHTLYKADEINLDLRLHYKQTVDSFVPLCVLKSDQRKCGCNQHQLSRKQRISFSISCDAWKRQPLAMPWEDVWFPIIIELSISGHRPLPLETCVIKDLITLFSPSLVCMPQSDIRNLICLSKWKMSVPAN